MSDRRTSPSKFHLVNVSSIDPNPFASRLKLSVSAELATSLSTYGQLTAVRLRQSPKDNGRFEVVFGHRRVEAARQLGWRQIQAEICDVTDEEMITLALAENLERNNFTDYEIGLFLRRLSEEWGRTIDEIANQLGRSKSYVSQHISLTRLFDSEKIDRKIAEGLLQNITEREARILFRLNDPLQRFQIAKFAQNEKLGLRELERLVGHPRDSSLQNADIHSIDDHSSSREKPHDDIKEIRQVVIQILEGVNQRDLRPYLKFRSEKLYSQFNDVPPFDLVGYHEAIDKSIEFYRLVEHCKVDFEKLRIQVFAGFAYSTFIATYRIQRQGHWILGRSRVTFIFIKEKGRWLVVHEHSSPVETQFMMEMCNLYST
jgi:ParB/RepB/Spo0J family partition protein